MFSSRTEVKLCSQSTADKADEATLAAGKAPAGG
jgi:hypothetical protein